MHVERPHVVEDEVARLWNVLKEEIMKHRSDQRSMQRFHSARHSGSHRLEKTCGVLLASTLALPLVAACSASDGGSTAGEPVASQQQALGTLVRVPGLVMGLLHNSNQVPAGTLMYSASPSQAIQRDGGDWGADNHRGYEWWQLPDPTTNSSGYESILPPGVVVALKHNSNQASISITAFGRDPVTGPASFPGFARQVGGDRGAPNGVGYFWYESTGTSFTNWAGIDAILPKYSVVGLKNIQNQPSKTILWNGVTYDPAVASPVPPGFRRMVGGDLGDSSYSSFYWYEKTTGTEIASKPTLQYPLSRSLFMSYWDPGSLDRDGDCLVDAMENELATKVRPYVKFDNQEEQRRPGEPVGVFRVYPTASNAVRIHYLLLFQQDGGYGPSNDNGCENFNDHPGDNDSIDFDLSTSNGGGSFALSKFELSYKGINWSPTSSRLESYSARFPIAYLSGSKHHEYLTRDIDGEDSTYSDVPIWDDCNDDVNGLGAQLLMSPFGFNGPRPNNVGEPGRHPESTFTNHLDAVTPGTPVTVPNKPIWDGELFYSSDCNTNASKFPPVAFPACASNGCSHSVCSEGPPLSTGCFADVANICSFDPYCCNNWWDGWCVAEVASGCNADPAPSSCGTANEYESLTLSCPVGQRIADVRFASYGLPAGQCGSFSATSCHASSSVATIGSQCIGKQSCTVAASNDVFGDPCPGYIKQLSAEVRCDTLPIVPATCGTLEAGEGFFRNQELTSCDGRFAWKLSPYGDFSLVQRMEGPGGGTMELTLFGPYAQTSPGASVRMQTDGNLVFYDYTGYPLWSSNTWAYPNATLRLHNDGNLVIYDVNGVVRWTSNTCCH